MKYKKLLVEIFKLDSNINVLSSKTNLDQFKKKTHNENTYIHICIKTQMR